MSDYSHALPRYDEPISFNNIEDLPDLNLLLNVTDEVDLNNVSMENLPTAFTNLRKFVCLTYIDEEKKVINYI